MPMFLSAAVSSLSLLAPPVLSQDEDSHQVAPVIVTATRTPQTVGDTLASVSVIDRDEIDRRQSTTMADVLRGLRGVTLTSSGGLGHTTNVYLRGTRPDHVLLLVDGVKLGTATSGFLPWPSIPLGQVERVEVVRGPASSLYGSEAIGGVVQVFTRRGEPGPLTPRFSVMAGSRGTAELQLGLSGGAVGDHGDFWLDAGIGFLRTDGFDVCDGPGGCGVVEPDDDGYEDDNASLRAGWRLSDRLELDVSFLRSDGELEYDGSLFFGNEKHALVQVLGARLMAIPAEPWTVRLRAGRSWDDSEIFADGSLINRLDTTRDQLSLENDLAVAPGQLVTLGVDYERDRLDTATDYAVTSRDNIGLFGQYLASLGAHDVRLGLRNDDNEQFGEETTGNLAWGYALGNGWRLTASYGTAFKAPTFNDLYYPGYGNADLEPEHSWSAELGLSGGHPWGEWAANAYQTEIDDLIAFDAATFSPQNIDRARIRGLELLSTADIAGWQMKGTLTLLDPRNVSGGSTDGNLLPRRPKQTFQADLDRAFGQIQVGGTLFVSGRRFDDDENEVRLDGFALVDLRAEYALSDVLRIQGRVENLLDEDYETAADFNQPGRSLFLTLLYQP
jgi:vitamin B12 transporter